MRSICFFFLLFILSMPLGASEHDGALPVQVKLLSNPVGDQLRLHMQVEAATTVTLFLEDMEGTRISLGRHPVSAASWLTLPVSKVPTGLYTLVVLHDRQAIKKRVLKQ